MIVYWKRSDERHEKVLFRADKVCFYTSVDFEFSSKIYKAKGPAISQCAGPFAFDNLILQLQLICIDPKRRRDFLAGGFAWFRDGFLLRISRLGNAQTPGHFVLGQVQVFAPCADRGGPVHDAADHIMGNDIAVRVLGDLLRIGDDDERGLTVRSVDDLNVSRCVHRVFLPLEC